MTHDRRFRLYAMFLAIVAAATIWIVGSGEATPHHEALWAQSERPPVDTDRGPAGPGAGRETLYKYSKLLTDISYRIQSAYMDTINTKEMIYSGIRGMLDVLDPFSVLMEQQNYDRLMESTHGKYEGLGMQIDLREDTVTVVSPIEGTPAQRMGLQAGDRIIAIDGKNAVGMTTEAASKLMRGSAGTKVSLTINRAGLPEPLEYVVERAVIELKSVPYYGMADEANKIGYLRLNKFSETTDRELADGLTALKSMGAQSVIFDLRSNGGGLLDQAVKTANLFIEKDKLIVYTQGRDPESQRKYFSTESPLAADMPMIVLVDDGTASASEIVSGAIQDWDRGLIVGNTTFGKGLVQQVFRLPDTEDVALKLTTARYYVPSGRSIQKPSRSSKHPKIEEGDEAGAAEEDTTTLVVKDESEIFYTNKGRKVYGGGGIVPDVLVERELYKQLEINLLRQGKFFNYSIYYSAKNPNIPMNFEATDEILADFRQYLADNKFDYKTDTEVELDKMLEELKDDPERLAIYQTALDQMKALVAKEKEHAFEESKIVVKREIERAMLNKVYGERGFYEGFVLKNDAYINKAKELLLNKDEYKKLLATDTKKSSDKS
jgi:carboxyl-terminal processing protease